MRNPLLFLSESSGPPPYPEPPQMSAPLGPDFTRQLPLINPQSGKPVDYRVIPFNFANALNDSEFRFRGNLIHFVYGTSAGGTVPIIWVKVCNGNGPPGDAIPFTPGVGYRGLEFDRLLFTNAITFTEVGYLMVQYDSDPEDLEAT